MQGWPLGFWCLRPASLVPPTNWPAQSCPKLPLAWAENTHSPKEGMSIRVPPSLKRERKPGSLFKGPQKAEAKRKQTSSMPAVSVDLRHIAPFLEQQHILTLCPCLFGIVPLSCKPFLGSLPVPLLPSFFNPVLPDWTAF